MEKEIDKDDTFRHYSNEALIVLQEKQLNEQQEKIGMLIARDAMMFAALRMVERNKSGEGPQIARTALELLNEESTCKV